jgi:hypothetical protein
MMWDDRIMIRNDRPGSTWITSWSREACDGRVATLPDVPKTTIGALTASGMSRWEAIATLFDLDRDMAMFIGLETLSAIADAGYGDTVLVVKACDYVAAANQEAADALLRGWVARGRIKDDLDAHGREWLTGLPDGTMVGGKLDLEGCPGVLSLPEGLQVGTVLRLRGSGVIALPRGLKVGRHLDLTGCRAWDGTIPEDTSVGSSVRTDAHPDEGIMLSAWRKLHPDGER